MLFNTSGFTTQFIYHHDDHLSGTSIETDEKGNVIEMTDYYPFGEIRIDQSFTNDTTSGTPTSTGYKNPYKFTGKELDTDIGLYYYGARYYNPAIGRFVSMDRISSLIGSKKFDELLLTNGGAGTLQDYLSDPQNLNSYSYVGNNPLKYIDPTGNLKIHDEGATKKQKKCFIRH